MLNPVDVWKEENSFFKINYLANTQANTFACFTKSIAKNDLLVQKELEAIKVTCQEENQSLFKWMLYRCLSVFGGLYAFFAGFDGMLAVLTALFPVMQIGLLISLGLVAAFSGLGVFLARDNITIAEALEISEEINVDLANDYLFHLAKYYDIQFKKSLENPTDLNIINSIANIRALKELFEDKSRLNQEIKQKPISYIQTQLVVGIGAILFFSDGFFIGQGLALLIASLLAINPGVLVFGVGIALGLMALSAYCFVEKPYLEKYLYQDLFTDESKVKSSLDKISVQLQYLEKLECAQESAGDAKKLKAPPSP